jgi:hypothetical protein
MAAALAHGQWATRFEAPPARVKEAKARLESYKLPVGQGRRTADRLPENYPATGRLRLRQPLIERLKNAGELDEQHVQAAEDIRFIVQGWEQGVSIRPVDHSRLRSGAGGQPAELALMKPAAAAMYRRSMVPFVERWLARSRADLMLTMDAVLTSPVLRTLERRYKLRNGVGKTVIRIVLDTWPRIEGLSAGTRR